MAWDFRREAGERPPPESQRQALSAYPLQRGRSPATPPEGLGRPAAAEGGGKRPSGEYPGTGP